MHRFRYRIHNVQQWRARYKWQLTEKCHYNHTIKLAQTGQAPLPSELTFGTTASVAALVEHTRMSILLTSSYHEWQSLMTLFALLHPLSDMGFNRRPLAQRILFLDNTDNIN
jgi:hypothetical protein